MIPAEILLGSPTHALHKTLPLHHHTISSSSTRLQRCIFSWERMRVSTAYVGLYHPGKSWSWAMNPCWAPRCPSSGIGSQARHLKTEFETSADSSSPLQASPDLCTDPSGTAWHQGQSQHLHFPAQLHSSYLTILSGNATCNKVLPLHPAEQLTEALLSSKLAQKLGILPGGGFALPSSWGEGFCQCPHLGTTDTLWLQQTQPKPQTSPWWQKRFQIEGDHAATRLAQG